MEPNKTPSRRWVDLMTEEDLAFVKNFVLSSGSLKDIAAYYKVSYPTVRLRLDRVIQKIQVIEDQKISDPFEALIRSFYTDGKLDDATFRTLLASYLRQPKDTKKGKQTNEDA